MPELTNPFLGLTPRKMTKQELARAIRQDVIAELDAAALYEAHMEATDDEAAKRVIKHVLDQEKEHVGDFLALLEHLDPDQAGLLAQGIEESGKLIRGETAPQEAAPQEAVPTPQGLTVGNPVGQD